MLIAQIELAIIVTAFFLVGFWIIEIATMLLRVKDFKHGNKKCKMVQYVKNVFICRNKGDYQNRAVFSNSIFFLLTAALMLYLATRTSSSEQSTIFREHRSLAQRRRRYNSILRRYKRNSIYFQVLFLSFQSGFLDRHYSHYFIHVEDIGVWRQAIITELVHLAGFTGIIAVLFLLMVLSKRMESVGPFFRKVGAISLILVWVFFFTPFLSILGLVTAFKAEAQIIELIFFSFIILGLFILMAFVNQNIKRFHLESEARSAAVSLKNKLKYEAVRVNNILRTREIYDSFYQNFHTQSRNKQRRNTSAVRDILRVNKYYISQKENAKFISFYHRQEFDLLRIKENDSENLNQAKELMLLDQCRKKERWRETKKNDQEDKAQRRATRNLKILQRALTVHRATVAKMKRRKEQNDKNQQKCKKFLARFLRRFNDTEVDEEDENGYVPDRQYKKIQELLKDERNWKRVNYKLQENRSNLMDYMKSGGAELERLKSELEKRYYNPDSRCESKLREMLSELKQFARNPKAVKEFNLETKLVEFYESLNSLHGDADIYWPRVLQLMIFFSLKAQTAFIKAIYTFWHHPQNLDNSFQIFISQDSPQINCIRPGHNYEFKEITLLADQNIPNSTLEDIFSQEDLLKELTGYAGRLPQFKEVRDLNMRRKLYLCQVLEYMMKQRLNKSLELIFFNDDLIVEIISTIRKQQRSQERRQKCLEILLKPISCWADLFEKRSKKFKEYERTLEEQKEVENQWEDALDVDLNVEIRRLVVDCKSDRHLIQTIDAFLRKQVKDPSKVTQKCKDNKLSFISFTVLTTLSYFTLISNSLSAIPMISKNPKELKVVPYITGISQFGQGQLSGYQIQQIQIVIVLLVGFGSIFLFANMYRQIMQVGYRMTTAPLWQRLLLFLFKLLYTSFFLPLNKLLLRIVMCEQVQNTSIYIMKIYENIENPYFAEPKFFGQDIQCYETTAYNVIASLSLIAWLIYFSVGTFVVSKLQFLNRTSPFIVHQGFATMLQLFKFFSVLLLLTTYNYKHSSTFTVGKLVILSFLLLVMAFYTLLRNFAFHPFARGLHTAGIFILMMVNLALVIWITANKDDFK